MQVTSISPRLILATSLVLTIGCGGAKFKSEATTAAAPAAQAPVLKSSVFARDPQGHLSEAAIQKILGSQLELELPARVGILPILPARDWRGPEASYERAPTAVAELAAHVRSPDLFTVVTEMLPIPSGALGMEGLREMAARYKLRYIVLYREDLRQRIRNNIWAFGYATGLGTLFLPGESLKVDGYVEASLFDVKTGLLLFTTRRRVNATESSNVWHRSEKLSILSAKLAVKVGEDLAKDIRRETFNYAAAVEVENANIAQKNAAQLPVGTGVAASEQ